MAKFQSAQFNAISGKVGGMVFASGPDGPVMRKRTVPKQPRTDAQEAVRISFQAGSDAWKILSNAQKAGWSSLAAKVTLKNQLNQSYTPTGRRLFMSCWQNSATVYGGGPDTAPAVMPSIGAPYGFNVSATPPGGTHPQGQITVGGTFPLSGVSMVLRATPPLSFDKRFLSPSDFRVLAVVSDGGSAPTPGALAGLYAAKFGPLQPDARVAFAAFLTDANGFVGPVATTNVIVSASALASGTGDGVGEGAITLKAA